MNINVLGLSDDDFLFHILQKSCHENLSDSSLWFNLRNYIVCTNQIVDVSYVVDEYNRINAQYGITKLISSSRSNQVVSNADKLLVDEFKWLIQVQCKHKTPFFALISSIQTPDTLNTLINLLEGSNLEIKSDIQNYIQSESL
ncbi:hypothetical protein G210_4490 [Candida maltosa Xu316]|uniref:Uncharacterized protein n=1 Tax=Candida maltosa (strain Xu316) TaxID=1245528 RepID=M3JRC5_CANMX|nr:hypothetical protein G210_4490 [Candida maltosa Xu316]